jgi:hypothetical protein
MLRRNLLKSLSAIIPISFLGKFATANCGEVDDNIYFKNKLRLSKNANEKNPNYVYKNIVETKSGKLIRMDNSDGYWQECTYDENEKQLTYKDSRGFWNKRTYNENGKQLTYESSDGCWTKSTYDQNGNQLTYKDSKGSWYEKTYNEKGQILSSKGNNEWIVYAEDSNGNTWEQSRWTV